MRSAKRIYLLADGWRGCREPLCKRHHLCCTPRGLCSNAPPPEPLSENARRLIDRVWQRRLARAAPAPSAAG